MWQTLKRQYTLGHSIHSNCQNVFPTRTCGVLACPPGVMAVPAWGVGAKPGVMPVAGVYPNPGVAAISPGVIAGVVAGR